MDGTSRDVRRTYRNEEVEDDGVNHADDHKPLEREAVFKMCNVDTGSVVYIGHNKLYAPSELTSLKRRLQRNAQQG